MHTANCGPPSLPVNGYILSQTNTLEGAEVTYVVLCDRNESLVHKEAVTCAKSGQWEPNISDTCGEAGLRDSSGIILLSTYNYQSDYYVFYDIVRELTK